MSRKYAVTSPEEAKFLQSYDADKYKKASFTVDVAVYAKDADGLWLLLIERGGFPAKGQLALPGGFLNMDEELHEAAARELFEETGVSNIPLVQCYTMGGIGRDPRDRVLTGLYTAVIDKSAVSPKAGDDAKSAFWFRLCRHETAPEFRGGVNAMRHILECSNGSMEIKIDGAAVSGFAPPHQSDIVIHSSENIAFDHDEEIMRSLLMVEPWL